MKLSVRKKLFISFFIIVIPLMTLVLYNTYQDFLSHRNHAIHDKKQDVKFASGIILQNIKEVAAVTRLIADDLIRDHGLATNREQMLKDLRKYKSTIPSRTHQVGFLDDKLNPIGDHIETGKKHKPLSEIPKSTDKDLLIDLHNIGNEPYVCVLIPLNVPAASYIHVPLEHNLIRDSFLKNKANAIAITAPSGKTMIINPDQVATLSKSKSLIKTINTSDHKVINFRGRKHDVISSDFFEAGWRVSLISPAKLIPLFGLEKTHALSLLLTIMASALFSVLAGTALTKPLRMLRKYANNISNLNFSQVKPIKSGDEFELLFNTFNDMNARLKKYINGFNEKNTELMAIINNMQNGVIITDKNGKIVTLNKTAKQFFGWCNCAGKDQSTCLPYLQTLDGDELSPDESPMMIPLKGKKFSSLILEAKNPDTGKKLIFNFHGTPLKNDDKKIYGAAVMFTDITEQYRLQERLRRLVSYEKIKTNHLSILHNVSLILNKEKDILKIEETVLKAAVAITDANSGIILKKIEGKYKITSRHTTDDSEKDDEFVDIKDIEYLFKNKLFRDQKSLKIANFSKFNKELRDKECRIKALTATPIFSGKHNLVSHLILVNKKKGRRFSAEDEKVAQILCSHANVALTNAINYKREHHIAQVLQKSLLPTTSFAKSMSQNIQVSLAYKPATGGAMVGGDFYDFFDLGDNKTGCVIADVNGKGVEAATITSQAKNTIKAFAYEGYPADKVLQKTNNVLHNQTGPSVFVTAIFGILDLNNGFFEYANAGHHEPLLYRDDINKVLKLNKGSTPLGVLQEEDYDLHVCDLKPQDSLVLFTDGLIEGRKNGQFFGEERLINCLLANAPLPLSLADKILADLEDFTDGNLNDDVAIVALRFKEPLQQLNVEKRISVWS